MIEDAVRVAVSPGFTWTAAFSGASFIALLGILVRQAVPWRKTSIAAEERLRDDLLRRVEKLERVLERERARHNAERALDRHRLNNVTQCLDALLLMLEAAPEKAAEIVARIKDMRAAQLQAEALEKGAMNADQVGEAAADDGD